jgi:hypothetical protein
MATKKTLLHDGIICKYWQIWSTIEGYHRRRGTYWGGQAAKRRWARRRHNECTEQRFRDDILSLLSED